MITHFEAILSLLSIIIGLLVSLATGIWKARGWVDRLNATDQRLAEAIETLTRTQQQQHAENQQRFRELERGRRR